MSLQDALGVSKNTTAAQAMIDLVTAKGYDYWIDYCKKLGFSDEVAEGSAGCSDGYGCGWL